ncbi:hypothetical protein G6F59_015458 [Rhizopus arrhizus]|nr:hypothetical protein G6F59_015458 [Rhizopus arrhizus]
MGHCGSGGVAADLHHLRRLHQDLRQQSGAGLHGTGAQVPGGACQRHHHRAGQVGGADEADRGQRLRQYRADRAVPAGGGRGAGVFDQDHPGRPPQPAAQRPRDPVRGAEAA